MTDNESAPMLTRIVETTRAALEGRKLRTPVDELEQRAAQREPRREAFIAALRAANRTNVIAECKRRSPSRGMLRPHYDPAAIAREYEQAGAAAISVVTESAFFDGSLCHIRYVRAVTDLPVLRKDFIVDEYQLLEARAAGADAVLLIAAALDPMDLPRLLASARAMGFAVLVEAHDEHDLVRAVDAGAEVIGINNRDLRTLQVDLRTAARLFPLIPPGVTTVAESGIRSGEDLSLLRDCGYDAFLVGEPLMTASRPGAALAALLRAVPPRGRQRDRKEDRGTGA